MHQTPNIPIQVRAAPGDNPDAIEHARRIAAALNTQFEQRHDRPRGESIVLIATTGALSITIENDCDKTNSKPVTIDWLKLDTKSNAGRRLSQPIAKAVGIKKRDAHRPHIVDATAGFGEDAWLLASLGCRVTAIERNPIIALLLADARRRATLVEPEIAQRIALQPGDAADVLSHRTSFEVIYLDPMYPGTRKTKERKPLTILRRIVGEDPDAKKLFDIALSTDARRIVVKRSQRAPAIDDRAPDIVFPGRGFRFDVYLKT